MKSSTWLRSLSATLAAVALGGLLLSTTRSASGGNSGGVHGGGAGGGPPTPDCSHTPPTVCAAPSDCYLLTMHPVCSKVSVGCGLNNACLYESIVPPPAGCLCREFETRTCILPNGSQGTQTCGRVTTSTANWCPCT